MIEALASGLAALPGAGFIRGTATAYLLVNAAHILGIGLLVGSILPLDLRLAGLFPRVPLAAVGPFLLGTAQVGLTLALLTGVLLLSVEPGRYFDNTAFRVKLGLLIAAGVLIVVQHRQAGFRTALAGGAVALPVRLVAAGSVALWMAVLVAGRWIGFV